MTETEFEEAIDRLILESGLSATQVVGVLDMVIERYEEQVNTEE